MDLGRFQGHGPPFCRFVLIHLVGPIGAGAHPVGGHNRHFEFVGFLELHLLGFGRAGHARQAGIEQEEVLVGDAGQGLGFRLDRQAFLRFDRLVLAIAPTAPRHHPASEFIHNYRIAFAHDVVDILNEQLLGLQGIGDVMGPGIGRVEQITHPQQLLSLGIALIGEGGVALLLINLIVAFGIDAVLADLGGAHQLVGHLNGPLVFLLGPLHLARDDQGRARLIDQDGINFINDAVMEIALHHLGDVIRHVVAQVIKAQL